MSLLHDRHADAVRRAKSGELAGSDGEPEDYSAINGRRSPEAGRAVRAALIETGALVPHGLRGEVTPTHASAGTTILRLDRAGREAAAYRLAHPEPEERQRWRRDEDT